jgi:NAD(P)-dependent dehydrogenase (short-subunit alcohol dehydrogenase family)
VLFASQGAKVAIADISAERAAATLDLVEKTGCEGLITVGDLASVDDNARCVREATDSFGGLDIVVNNVAISGGGGSPADVDLDAWKKVMTVNLDTTLLTVRHTLPHLKATGGGSIINISSITAIRGYGAGAYTASKAAIIGLTRDWAYLHGRDHIRVNCLIVGHAYTPMGNGGAPRESRRRANLLDTEGVAWDIAWPAVFLASDESRWITGVDLPVDAGTTTTGPLAMQLLNERGNT